MNDLWVTIDRVERDQQGNQLAVLLLDDGQQLTLPLERLPDGATEGMVLRIDLTSDNGETERRRSAVKQVQSRLFGHRSRASDHDTREHQ
jgi:hypothetical protein